MADRSLHILLEDNHLLALNKPAGIATMGTSPETPSIVQLAKRYLQRKYHKPGNVYLGVVSRLDALVSGVLLLARTSKAARRLTDQFARHTPQKTYLAIVSGAPLPDEQRWVDWLEKDERAQRMVCTAPSDRAKRAELAFRVLRRRGSLQLVEIQLVTGRKHQIRVQFAARGCPVLGDRKYGSRQQFLPGIALHARRLTLLHPVRRTELILETPPPSNWPDFC